MSTEVRLQAPSRLEAQEWFSSIVRMVGRTADILGEEQGIPETQVTATICDDFAATVTEVLRHAGRDYGQRFTTERVGGVVAAKTIVTGPDTMHIVFNAGAWEQVDTGHGQASTIVLVAHEYAHALMERAADESAALAAERIPSMTGAQVARSIARITAGEMRADLIAGMFLGALASVEDGGENRPVGLSDLWGDGYGAELRAVLDTVHPGWPNTVDDYRHGRMTLNELAEAIIQSTEGVLTLLAHADAVRHGSGEPSVLDSLDHPAVSLYLRDAWETIRGTLLGKSLLPELDQVAEHERHIMHVGSGAILDMWGRLGLTVEEKGNDGWALWLDEPQR